MGDLESNSPSQPSTGWAAIEKIFAEHDQAAVNGFIQDYTVLLTFVSISEPVSLTYYC